MKLEKALLQVWIDLEKQASQCMMKPSLERKEFYTCGLITQELILDDIIMQ